MATSMCGDQHWRVARKAEVGKGLNTAPMRRSASYALEFKHTICGLDGINEFLEDVLTGFIVQVTPGSS